MAKHVDFKNPAEKAQWVKDTKDVLIKICKSYQDYCDNTNVKKRKYK